MVHSKFQIAIATERLTFLTNVESPSRTGFRYPGMCSCPGLTRSSDVA